MPPADPTPPGRRRRGTAPKARGWPAPGRPTQERQWRAWVAYQVGRWRADGGWVLKQVGEGTGLKPHTVSEIESGKRALSVTELARLARFYGRRPKDMVRLCTPPTPAQWRLVRQKFGMEPEFAAPPAAFPSAESRGL